MNGILPEQRAHILHYEYLRYCCLKEEAARAYFCFHAGAQPRYQGTADFPRYLESFERAGMNPEFWNGAQPAGPLATFDGAEAWVEHPYRDGVACCAINC